MFSTVAIPPTIPIPRKPKARPTALVSAFSA